MRGRRLVPALTPFLWAVWLGGDSALPAAGLDGSPSGVSPDSERSEGVQDGDEVGPADGDPEGDISDEDLLDLIDDMVIDEDDEEEPEDGSALSEFFSGVWASLREDPTLGGRLRLSYRATWRARFYDFGPYDFPFDDPAAIGEFDRLHAEQLERRHRDDRDHDVDQYFSLTWKDFYRPDDDSAPVSSVGLRTSFRFFADLDGSPGGEASLDTYDAFDGNLRFELLTLHATVEAFRRHLVLTFGRQYAHEAEWIHFDGVEARFRGLTFLERAVELTAFGGTRVKLFPRTVSSRDGIWGGSVTYRPFRNTLLKLSDVFYSDNSFEAELRHRFPGRGWTAVRYRQINEDPESVRFEGHVDWAEADVKIYLTTVHKLGRTADDFDFDYTRSRRREGDDPLFLNLGDLAPYDHFDVEVRKGFLRHYGFTAGGTLHLLRARGLEDNYNTDWHELRAGFDVLHAPWKGLTGRFTFRYLHTDLPRRLLRLDPRFVLTNDAPDFLPEDITGDGEPDFLGLEMILEQDLNRIFSVGATLELRSYDYQSNYVLLENLSLTSVSAYLRWRPTARTQWRLEYAFTRDFRFLYPDLDGLHTIQVQFAYRL